MIYHIFKFFLCILIQTNKLEVLGKSFFASYRTMLLGIGYQKLSMASLIQESSFWVPFQFLALAPPT